ncbi:hypothetical protein PVAND_011126 [Polypedilum vanderplanki]|uniref:NADH dehydrogenase [ubiquinone] 1 beta subcomplex subunit 4 n=1 Tax=Polypedilum vanderplanki TaxID=319348 RepID=A0A9J6CI64_POLVA|nr:hypothetical protein PVAND_011126 [Polypedilum vanderplanki]
MAEEGLRSQQKRVLELRQQFLRKSMDPYRHMTGEGGHVFDPGFYRFQAMRATQWDHFKPTAKTAKYGFWFLIFPLTTMYYLVSTEREAKEKKYRTGQVAYQDRSFKFI